MNADASRRLAEIRGRLPFARTMPGIPPTVRDLDSLVDWLDRYTTHAEAEVDKLLTERARGARASSILRELETVLANAVDEVADARAREHAREAAPLPGPGQSGLPGAGPYPG